MSKRNVRAKSGKQLYLNSVFNRGMLYTASEIPEGYAKLLDNLDVTPSGDAVSPRAPFMKTDHELSGLSKYTYPIRFQNTPEKQFYINFANTVTEYDYANDILKPDYSQLLTKPSINIYSRSSNALNASYALDENENPYYNKDTKLDDISINLSTEQVVIEFGLKHIYSIGCAQFAKVSDTSPYTTLNSFTVIDADTITINNSEDNGVYYRLANINAPEKGYKWYEYGKKFLESLLLRFKVTVPNSYFRLLNYGRDAYGRQIVDVVFPAGQTQSGTTITYYEVSLSTILVVFGFAEVDYLNNQSPFFQILLDAQKEAQEYKRFIWGVNNIDPFYKGANNTITYHNLKDDYVGDYSDLCLEAVVIQTEKRINYDTVNYIDKVMHHYIDYLDGIAFIGRITRNGKLYYKGVIYLRYELVNSLYYFRITLPPNNLNGEYVNIANATSNGYNLLNSNPINTDNVKDNSMPASCLGIVTVEPNESSRIITQSIVGNTIRLRAIMNESYYTTSLNNPFSYKLHYTLNGHPVVSDVTGDPYYIESEYLTDVSTARIEIQKLELVYKTYNKDSSYFIEFKEDNIYVLNVNEDDTTTGPEVNINVLGYGSLSVGCSAVLAVNKLIKDAVFIIKFNNNVLENLFNNSIKTAQLNTKWEYSYYGSEEFSNITEFIKSYDIKNGEVVRSNSSNNDTVNFTIKQEHNLTFKFTIVPVYKIIINNDEIYCYYQTQESYTVYPLFKVGTAVEYIDKRQLTENININAATRLGVFNRQVYLYGPYLKTNTIFFSKFEEPWYFSFPYYAINTEERIKYCYEWDSNLVLFGDTAIWLLVTDGTVNESTVHKIYDKLSISDTDIDLVTTAGNNLIFFNNSNGYIATSSKYYNDPTNISVYKLTDNINNCLMNPKYLYRSLTGISLIDPVSNVIRCNYKIYVDNDYIVIMCNLSMYNYNLLVFYRYNQLYKYWSTYSIVSDDIKHITSPYVCEPNYGVQYTITNDSTFEILYIDNTSELRKDFNKYNVVTTLDTGFLSIDPLNDKRFKDIVLDLNNIQKDSTINVYMNFFIDNLPITLSSNNTTADFEYVDTQSPPLFKEGDYQFKYVLEVDPTKHHEQPYGEYIEGDDYAIRAQGRNQLRIPVFGKGRLPSIVFKISTDRSYEIVGYSIIYKEKNVNIRR